MNESEGEAQLVQPAIFKLGFGLDGDRGLNVLAAGSPKLRAGDVRSRPVDASASYRYPRAMSWRTSLARGEHGAPADALAFSEGERVSVIYADKKESPPAAEYTGPASSVSACSSRVVDEQQPLRRTNFRE